MSTEQNLYPFQVHQNVTITTDKSSMSFFPLPQHLASEQDVMERMLQLGSEFWVLVLILSQ